jgi:hypothetical protein
MVAAQRHPSHPASARDALYNAAATPIRRSPLGTAGRYVGDELEMVPTIIVNELEMVPTIIVNPNSDWQLGLAQFWSGPFVERTAATPAEAANGHFFYSQFTVRF